MNKQHTFDTKNNDEKFLKNIVEEKYKPTPINLTKSQLKSIANHLNAQFELNKYYGKPYTVYFDKNELQRYEFILSPKLKTAIMNLQTRNSEFYYFEPTDVRENITTVDISHISGTAENIIEYLYNITKKYT